MDRDLLLSLSDDELSALCRLEFCRGTGNGGQKRNKTSTAARVVLLEDGRFAASDCSERSLIAFEVRCAPPVPPPRISCGVTHAGYPLNLAHLLDVLDSCSYDHKAAAALCGVTVSAFLKLLKRDDALWEKVNDSREALGLYKLKCN